MLLSFDTPDAIVCANDAMAIALCDLLKKRNLKVPDDVIVTGIDGSVRSDYYIPSITTIDKNQHDMAVQYLTGSEHSLTEKILSA